MRYKKVGNRLIKLRGNLSREEVAYKLGITYPALISYELGNRVPKDSIKIKFSRFYGVSVQELFYDDLQE